MFIKLHKREKGFTLVELIIVLAIIGILSALAISRIGYNRTRAANTTCNAIMGDIKKAAEAYYADTGVQLDIDIVEDCGLIEGGYMAGVPRQPHDNTGGEYHVSFVPPGESDAVETAFVNCAKTNTVVFPEGH